MPDEGWGSREAAAPRSQQDPAQQHPCSRTRAGCLGNEPDNRACHLLAGIKWEVLVVAATKSVKKSPGMQRLGFILAGEGRDKQNMEFCVRLRGAQGGLTAQAPFPLQELRAELFLPF